MISAMRQLALDYLMERLASGEQYEDPERWYRTLRKQEPERLFPYLVEDSGKVDKVFILERTEEEGLARLTVQDVVADTELQTEEGGCLASKLPFIKPSGSQSAAVGPVIKRTYAKDKGGGPSEKIVKTTLEYFREVAYSDKPWAKYFTDVLKILQIPRVKLTDGRIVDWAQEGYSNILDCVIDLIGPQKNTVFLTVRDSQGKLPGEQPLYLEYLLKEKLAGDRYVTKSTPAQPGQQCPLCDNKDEVVYPNALKGAGINLLNVDRDGVFPGLDPSQAWKGFALCADCADLLYVFKFHVLKKEPPAFRQPFGTRVAGENALIIPGFFPGLAYEERREILLAVQRYVSQVRSDVEAEEENLLELMAELNGILNFTVIWADVGQNIENVTGLITQVLPSRLRRLSAFNATVQEWESPLFSKEGRGFGRFNFKLNLGLSILGPLFYRPGGEKAQGANKSKRLFQLKRQIAECVYHGKPISEEPFWEEVINTARWYYMDSLERKEGSRSFTVEYINKNEISLATWIKQVNRFIYYLKQKEVGVLPMETVLYKPELDSLKPFFGPESGIDSPAKAYAFLLGILYGKLLQIQAARKVNVGANALTWLKRLTLKGKDLPHLYIKTREKLLAYDAEKSSAIRSLIGEIGRLGIQLGDNIELDEIKTNYYLLLGQSMTETVLPSKTEESKGGEDQ